MVHREKQRDKVNKDVSRGNSFLEEIQKKKLKTK